MELTPLRSAAHRIVIVKHLKKFVYFMKKPWSISTTVRNPERLREFLQVLKMIEGAESTKILK